MTPQGIIGKTGKAALAAAFLLMVFATCIFAPEQALAATTLHKTGFDAMPAQYIVFDNLDISKATFKANNSAFSRKTNYSLNNGQTPSAGIVWNRKTTSGDSASNPFSITFKSAGYETDTGKRVDLVLTCTNITSKKIRYLGSANTQISLMDQYASKSHFEIGNLPLKGNAVTYGIKQTYDVKVYYTGTTTTTKHPLLFYISDLDTVDSTQSSDSWSGAYAEGVNLVSGYGADTYVASNSLLVAESNNTRFRGTAQDGGTTRSSVAFTLKASGGKIAWTGSNDGCATWFFESFVKTITATAGANGSIKASGTNKTITAGKSLAEKVGWRTSKTYTVTPATGYKISSLKADGKAVAVTKPAGQAYTFSNVKADHTFTAAFTPITYKVAFDGNGATSGSTAAITGCKGATSYNLTANGFSRTGYSFAGWNTKADGSGTAYADKASFKNLTTTDGATVTLYAQWEEDPYAQRTVVVRIPVNDYERGSRAGTKPPVFIATHSSNRATIRCMVDFHSGNTAGEFVSAQKTISAPEEATCSLSDCSLFTVVDTAVEGPTTIFTLELAPTSAQTATASTINHIVVENGTASGYREDIDPASTPASAKIRAKSARKQDASPEAQPGIEESTLDGAPAGVEQEPDSSLNSTATGEGASPEKNAPVQLADGATVNASIPDEVEHIVFTDSALPENTNGITDLSAAGNQSVVGAYDEKTRTFTITSGHEGTPIGAYTDSSDMFAGKTHLETVDVSNLDVSTGRDLSGLFAGCTNLQAIDAAEWDISHVEDAGSMFDGCSSLATLKVGTGWNYDSLAGAPPAFPIGMLADNVAYAAGQAIPEGPGTYRAVAPAPEAGGNAATDDDPAEPAQHVTEHGNATSPSANGRDEDVYSTGKPDTAGNDGIPAIENSLAEHGGDQG